MKLEAGVYRLALHHPCSLASQNWTLTGTFRRTLNITLDAEPIGLNLNVSFSDLIGKQLEFDPLIFNLSELKPVERVQISMGDLLKPAVPRTLPKRNPFWSLFTVTGIPLVIAGIVLGRRRLIRSRAMSAGSKTETELNRDVITIALEPLVKLPSAGPVPEQQSIPEG
jgi:hypothetical protein